MATATMVFPIRELSADVQVKTATARRAVLHVAAANARLLSFALLEDRRARAINKDMGKLVDRQKDLVARLESFHAEQVDAPVLSNFAGDLSQLATSAASLVTDAFEMPEKYVQVWRENLEAISDLSSHIDNFAESFHIAADDLCSALIAKMANDVTPPRAPSPAAAEKRQMAAIG
jgi:hypothetical protein